MATCSPGLPRELGTPLRANEGGWWSWAQASGELVPPAELSSTQLRPPSPRSCTWNRGCPGGGPVEQVGLGTTPGRHQLPVPPPQWLDIDPVCTHQDVTLLEERELPGAYSPIPHAGPSQHQAWTCPLQGLLPKSKVREPICVEQRGSHALWGLRSLPTTCCQAPSHASSPRHAQGLPAPVYRPGKDPGGAPRGQEWRGS